MTPTLHGASQYSPPTPAPDNRAQWWVMWWAETAEPTDRGCDAFDHWPDAETFLRRLKIDFGADLRYRVVFGRLKEV